nr:reductive dehalogenase [uncultured bacterium]
MSKFHSTVSRRDFMKGLGLTGAGIGAASLVAPSFHDIDEITSSTQGPNNEWYVKELELDTVAGAEVDWQVLKRYDSRTTDYIQTGDSKEVDNVQWMKERHPGYGGPTLRDHARTLAATQGAQNNRVDFFGNVENANMRDPEYYEMPKWNGTPEENTRTLYSAFRFLGAAQMGVVPITEKTKKFFVMMDGDREQKFVDGEAEITDSETRIPNKCNNMIVFTTLEATSEVRHAPTPTVSGYDHYRRVTPRIHVFLHALGYKHIDVGGRQTQSNPFGALAGVGMHSRACVLLSSHRYGNLQRGMHRILTDMPLAPTHPVDSGLSRFCVNCATCAHLCPYESMPLGDPDWEPELEEDRAAGNFIPGWKGWRKFHLKNGCRFCKNCHTNCPFNGADTMIHELIRATQGVVPVFNGFFANMHDVFGYGDRNPDTWWDMEQPMERWDPWFTKPY